LFISRDANHRRMRPICQLTDRKTLRPFVCGFRLALTVYLLTAAPHGFAAPAEQAWQRVTALDAGPTSPSRTADEARVATLRHLNQQESALRSFLTEHGNDPHAFEAQLRLARLLQIRGDLTGNVREMAEAAQLLEQLDKTASAAQRPEVDFAKISYLMRTLRPSVTGQRERLLEAARRFQGQHPSDRRVAALLTEVASLFEHDPKTLRALLNDAQKLAKTPQLRAQIDDGLRRVGLLGQPLKVSWPTLDGKSLELDTWRGKVIVLVFFAVWSPPSTGALDTLRSRLGQLPGDSLAFVGISLDAEKPPLRAMLAEKKLTWPIGFDGQGWESAQIRALGINALPTVWLIDQRGRLRSLNGLEDTEGQVRQLLRER
jgi:peroxiredoxin